MILNYAIVMGEIWREVDLGERGTWERGGLGNWDWRLGQCKYFGIASLRSQ